MSVRAVIAEVLEQRHSKVLLLEKVHHGLAELEMQFDNLQQMAIEIKTDAEIIPAELVSLTARITQPLQGLHSHSSGFLNPNLYLPLSHRLN